MSEKAMMAGIVSEDFGPGGRDLMLERLTDEPRCQSVDSLTEWRSYEQVENGTTSTSPPYWDTDDEDDGGPKPSELYGKFTWKIENFSTISKRELRSNAFEVGGYKWFILIYPQGCDVCNHLSLFLCVANHEKLLPGWSHFAQFTIAVVNKDPKKSKYSDTLHRFWKKEHDWGWKKFMELSKVLDGFIVADTLVIKAQVQVIREKAHRPFRCLDCQYRRELLRVYLSNVEQICRRFVEERRGKLSKLIEDKVRWSSFRAFWLGIDHNARRRMCRDKTDAILKVVVKHFFIEKEVTSTLVMDSLYSGLKALECQCMNKKSGTKLLEMEKQIAPLVHVEKDMFVLADDVFPLLERAASEPLPHQPLPPKDDKGSQTRTKDGSSGEEFNKDSIERDERRLTELGRRTVEIFILTHIFSSRIEVAYQEAVALKRQEELIREEEAAGHAENERKLKHGASEKEKRSKKKQTKKRSSQKGKDRGRNEKSDPVLHDKHREDGPSDEKSPGDLSFKETQLLEKNDSLAGVSHAFDTRDEVADALQPDLEDRDASTISWDTDASEIHPTIEASGSRIQNGHIERRSPSVMDDSSSACSTESVPFAVMSGPYKGNSLPNNKSQTSPKRGKNQRGKEMREHTGSVHGGSNMPSDTATSADRICDTARANQPETEAVVLSLKDRILQLEQDLVEKEEEVSTLQKKLNVKVQVDVERPSKLASAEPSSSSSSLGKKLLSIEQQPKQTSEKNATNIAEPVFSVQPSSSGPAQTEKSASLTTRSPQISSMSEVQRQTTPAKSTVALQVAAVSRPLSAPLIPGPRPAAPIVSTVHTMPLLSRSVSAAGRLGTDRSPSAQSYIPQSYLNAIIGKTSMGASPAGLSYPSTSSSSQDAACSQSPSVFVPYSSVLPPQASVRKDQSPTRPGLTFGSVALGGALHSRKQCRDDFSSPLRNSDNAVRLNCKGELRAKQHSEEAASASSRLCGVMSEEFPHLDIINDLLDEQQSLGRAVNGEHQQHYHHHHSLSRQFTFPGSVAIADIGSSSSSSRLDQAKQYYDEGFPRVYGSSSGPLSGTRDAHLQQVDLPTFGNNQIDGLVQNRWSYSHADLSNPSMLNMGSPDSNGYSYQVADYSSLACGVNGYTMYRPANGL